MEYPDDYVGKVICGDCLQMMKDIPDKCIDLILTDPPYGVTDNDWDRLFTQQDLNELLRCSDNVVIFSGARPDQLKNITNLTPLCKRIYIWHHTFALTNSNGAFWTWQPFYVWGDKVINLKRDVLTYNSNDDVGRVHPTQKPIELLKDIILNSTQETDLVLDPFCGSGTTLVACKEMGRRFIGIEISPKYVEICNRRLAQKIMF